MESLPRGRDGEQRLECDLVQVGITPARAGRRPREHPRRAAHRNHSRAGGTERSGATLTKVFEESLPRGRDGAIPVAALVDGAGITPARAGRSLPARVTRSTERNHSRAGGTETHTSGSPRATRESLPRGRDGEPQPAAGGADHGITPARAGRSLPVVPAVCPSRNHSRAGGTEDNLPELDSCATESLPRGRDGGAMSDEPTPEQGITPARAGRRRPVAPRPCR